MLSDQETASAIAPALLQILPSTAPACMHYIAVTSHYFHTASAAKGYISSAALQVADAAFKAVHSAVKAAAPATPAKHADSDAVSASIDLRDISSLLLYNRSVTGPD